MDLKVETYQSQPPGVLVIPQIPSEVLVTHEFENQGKWVFLGRINPDKRHENVVIIVEVTACQRFLEQPLQVTLSKQNTLR